MIKSALVRISRGDAFGRFVNRLEQRESRGDAHLLRVLTYHRVVRPHALPPPAPGLWSTTPEEFERHIAHLARNYRVLSMVELLSLIRTQRPLPTRSAMVTFDDGYSDFVEHAWPILQRHRVPSTLFVATAFPDQPERAFWWDRLYQAIHHAGKEQFLTPLGRFSVGPDVPREAVYRQLASYVQSRPHKEAMLFVDEVVRQLGAPPAESRVLGWNQLRQLAQDGLTIGAHSRTHPMMNRLSTSAACREAKASHEDIQREIGEALPIFAYPGGAFNEAVVRGLRDAGFQLAFTTERGINDLRIAHPLRLRRINVGLRTTPLALRMQLLPWSIHMNRWQWTVRS